MSGFDTYANTAKAGVHAVRKTLSRALRGGQTRVKDVVDSSGRRADGSLDAVEQAVIRVLDLVAQRGAGYAADAKDKLYAAESRLFPRRRSRPIGTALVGVGVGLLLTLLFTAAEKPARRRSAKTA